MKTVFAIVAVALVAGRVEQAQAAGRVGIDGHGGWNTYSMHAFNQTVSSFNRDFGTAVPAIQDGSSWGLGLRLWPTPDFSGPFRIKAGYLLAARAEDGLIPPAHHEDPLTAELAQMIYSDLRTDGLPER